LVVLIMFPNIFYFVFSPTRVSQDAKREGIVLSIIEHGSQMVMIFMFVFLVRDNKLVINFIYIILILLCLLMYYYLWARYFMTERDYILLSKSFFGIPLPMAVFPIIYFVLAALWMGNWPAFGVALVFGVAHLAISHVTLD